MAEKKKKGFTLFRKKSKSGAAAGADAGAAAAPAPAAAPEPEPEPAPVGVSQTVGQPSGDGGAALYRRLEALKVQGAAGDPGVSAAGSSVGKLSQHRKVIESAKAGQAQKVRQKRLMKELKDIQKSAGMRDGVFEVELCDDNLFEWDVKLKKFDSDSNLAQDLIHMKKIHGIDDVWIRISFPANFPFDHPFVRVMAPLVQGGFVLTGGAICMELLTPEGWSQAYTIEAVIMQTMATIIKGDARIVARVKRDFSEAEARKAYDYLVKTHAKHGWSTPPKGDG